MKNSLGRFDDYAKSIGGGTGEEALRDRLEGNHIKISWGDGQEMTFSAWGEVLTERKELNHSLGKLKNKKKNMRWRGWSIHDSKNMSNKINKIAAINSWLQENPEPDYSFRNGGVLNERVLGLGQRSGKSYEFGEAGPEMFGPARATCMRYKGPFNSSGQPATWNDMQSGDYTFNITINGAHDARDMERQLRPIILKLMKESRARNGIL